MNRKEETNLPLLVSMLARSYIINYFQIGDNVTIISTQDSAFQTQLSITHKIKAKGKDQKNPKNLKERRKWKRKGESRLAQQRIHLVPLWGCLTSFLCVFVFFHLKKWRIKQENMAKIINSSKIPKKHVKVLENVSHIIFHFDHVSKVNFQCFKKKEKKYLFNFFTCFILLILVLF